MANNKSNYLENAIINHVLRGIALSTPGNNIFIALYTTDPTESDSGTEVSGGAYARVRVSGTTAWGAPANGDTENTGIITFTTATAAGGTVKHVAIRDASSGGNMLYYGPLTASKDVGINDIFRFPIGDLDIVEL